MTQNDQNTDPVGRGRIYNSITETVGNTPLVSLSRMAAEHGVEANLLAKLEFFNPIASVKDRIGVAVQTTPVNLSLIPMRALRRKRGLRYVIEGLIVYSNQSHAGSSFDRHVTQRHPPFHAQSPNRRTGKLYGKTGTACGPYRAHNRQGNIFPGHLDRQFPFDAYPKVLHFALYEAPCSQRMLYI